MFIYKSQIKVKASDPDKFVESFTENIGNNFQYFFSNVYSSSEKIELENGSLSFLMIWNFYEIITNAVVSVKRKNRIFTVIYMLNFTNYFIFWFVTSLLTLIAEIYCGLNDPSILGLPVLWVGIGFLFTMISQIKFRSKIIEIIESSSGKLLTY